jgi:transposase
MTKYNKELRDKVFKLYASGEPVERIGKSLGISRTTLYNWKGKYNWEGRTEKIHKKVNEQLDETLTDIKKRQRQIIKATLAKYIKDLQAEKVDISASEIAKIMNHELLLVGEPTERIEEQIDIGRMLDKISKFRKKKNE